MEQGTAVPVSGETREELRRLCDELGTTYDNLITAMLRSVDENALEVEPRDDVSGEGSLPERKRGDDVLDLVREKESNDELLSRVNILVENTFEEGELLRKHPRSIAAGAVYAGKMLINEKETQESVADRYDVTTLTLRNAFHGLLDANGIHY